MTIAYNAAAADGVEDTNMCWPWCHTTSNSSDRIIPSAGGIGKELMLKTLPASKDEQREVVFSTPTRYSSSIWILALALVVVNVLPIVVILLVGTSNNSSKVEKMQNLYPVLFCNAAILSAIVVVFPRSFEVRSDASIGVTTLFITYSFVDAVRGYKVDGILFDNNKGILLSRQRVKFATSLDHRVLVRRRTGLWDLLVSPHDDEGFIGAIEDVTQRLEFGQDWTSFKNTETTFRDE
jgi:hypothetical protein